MRSLDLHQNIGHSEHSYGQTLDFYYNEAVTSFNGNEKSILRKHLSLALLYHAGGMVTNVVIELIFDQLIGKKP